VPNSILEHVYLELLQNEDLQVKEAGLTLFYNIADTLEKDFVPLMHKLLPLAFEFASVSSAVIKVKEDQQDEFDLSSESEQELYPNDNVVQDTSKIAVKSAGIHLVASMINSSPADFFQLCNNGSTKVLELI